MDEKGRQSLTEAFTRHINEHGIAFQQAAIEKCNGIWGEHKFWKPIVTELPLGGPRATHIDFILQSKDWDSYLVIECKRANPARNCWCFSSAPNKISPEGTGQLIADGINVESDVPKIKPICLTIASHQINHSGAEIKLKGGKKGDERPGSTDILNRGIEQVLRGVNGYIDFMIEHAGETRELQRIDGTVVIPIIFTTAHLFESSVSLRRSDLVSGEIESMGTLQEQPWVFFDYPMSPALKHGQGKLNHAEHETLWIERLIFKEFVRTVIIVNAASIEQFLTTYAFDRYSFYPLK